METEKEVSMTKFGFLGPISSGAVDNHKPDALWIGKIKELFSENFSNKNEWEIYGSDSKSFNNFNQNINTNKIYFSKKDDIGKKGNKRTEYDIVLFKAFSYEAGKNPMTVKDECGIIIPQILLEESKETLKNYIEYPEQIDNCNNMKECIQKLMELVK